MQTTFKIEDGEAQKVKELEKMLSEGYEVISTTKIDYGQTTLFILKRPTKNYHGRK